MARTEDIRFSLHIDEDGGVRVYTGKAEVDRISIHPSRRLWQKNVWRNVQTFRNGRPCWLPKNP